LARGRVTNRKEFGGIISEVTGNWNLARDSKRDYQEGQD
jgi:hypothetical protein